MKNIIFVLIGLLLTIRSVHCLTKMSRQRRGVYFFFLLLFHLERILLGLMVAAIPLSEKNVFPDWFSLNYVKVLLAGLMIALVGMVFYALQFLYTQWKTGNRNNIWKTFLFYYLLGLLSLSLHRLNFVWENGNLLVALLLPLVIFFVQSSTQKHPPSSHPNNND